MSKFKKLIVGVMAVLLAALVVAPSVALAEGEKTYTITMDTTAGHTYEAYQVFTGDLSDDGKLSNIVWGNGVNGDALLTALKANANYGTAFTKCETAADVAKVLGTYDDKGADIKALAKIIAANKKTVAKSGTTSIGGLTAGYYLVLDSTTTIPDGQTRSDFMLEVVKDVHVTAKDSTVTSEKKVDDKNDSNTTEDETKWQDSADYDIGDDVPFQLKATVAENYADYTKYELTFHDVQSAGLTFNANSVKVYVDNKQVSSGFTVNSNPTDGCTFEIVFADLKQIKAVKAGSVVTVEYTSKLNEHAVIGAAGNPNTSHITYSNNPNSTTETGKTPDDKVIVFTYKLVANKVNENKEALTGAGFTLYKKNAAGEYVAVGQEIKGDQMTTFEWKGLDDGDYKLVETTTPSGYNTMQPQEFSITATHDIESADPKLETLVSTLKDFTATLDTGTIEGSIVNQSGSTLPSTGGMGTTLLYTIGGVLVAVSAVGLIARRKMSAEQ